MAAKFSSIVQTALRIPASQNQKDKLKRLSGLFISLYLCHATAKLFYYTYQYIVKNSTENKEPLIGFEPKTNQL